MKTAPLTSLKPVPANENGVVYFRAPAAITLADVVLDASQMTAILRIVAGPFAIEADAAKSWKDQLDGKTVSEGTFVNVHVQNMGPEPLAIGATLHYDDAAVHAAEVVSPHAPPPAYADARPHAIPRAPAPSQAAGRPAPPQFPGMRQPGKPSQGGGMMRSLGVVRHGVVDPEVLAKGGPRVEGPMATENPTKVFREVGAPLPSRGAVVRGDANTMAPVGGSSSVRRSTTTPRLVQSQKPSVQRGSGVLPVRPVTAGPAVVTAEATTLAAEACETADTATCATTDTPSGTALVAAPIPASVPAADARVAVSFMSGHAVALQALFLRGVPLRAKLRSPIASAILNAKPVVPDAPVANIPGVTVVLTKPEHAALLAAVRGGSPGHALHPGAAAAALRDAFARAIPPAAPQAVAG